MERPLKNLPALSYPVKFTSFCKVNVENFEFVLFFGQITKSGIVDLHCVVRKPIPHFKISKHQVENFSLVRDGSFFPFALRERFETLGKKFPHSLNFGISEPFHDFFQINYPNLKFVRPLKLLYSSFKDSKTFLKILVFLQKSSKINYSVRSGNFIIDHFLICLSYSIFRIFRILKQIDVKMPAFDVFRQNFGCSIFHNLDCTSQISISNVHFCPGSHHRLKFFRRFKIGQAAFLKNYICVLEVIFLFKKGRKTFPKIRKFSQRGQGVNFGQSSRKNHWFFTFRFHFNPFQPFIHVIWILF